MAEAKRLQIRQTQPADRFRHMDDGVGIGIAIVRRIGQGADPESVNDQKNDSIYHVRNIAEAAIAEQILRRLGSGGRRGAGFTGCTDSHRQKALQTAAFFRQDHQKLDTEFMERRPANTAQFNGDGRLLFRRGELQRDQHVVEDRCVAVNRAPAQGKIHHRPLPGDPVLMGKSNGTLQQDPLWP